MKPRNQRRSPLARVGIRAIAFCGLFSLSLLLSSCGGDPVEDDGAYVDPAIIGDPEPRPPADTIRPGELLDVFVLEDESFGGRYQVRSSGHLILPKLGRVNVGGMSISAAESSVKRSLEKSQLKEATVILDRAITPEAGDPAADGSGGVEVFLTGKIANPGRYTIVGVGNSRPTVHQAILQAGGFSRFAYKKKTHILRRGADGRLARIDADLFAIEAGEARDIPLASGDIIVVPEKAVDFGI